MLQPAWPLWIAFSLFAPIGLAWAKQQGWFPSDRLKLLSSAVLWAILAIDFYVLLILGRRGLTDIGFERFTWLSAARGFGIGGAGLITAGVASARSRRHPAAATRDAALRLATLPLWTRLIVLATVSVTEEVLFRAFPIGATALNGSPVWLVAGLGLLAFVAAHAQWGSSHTWFVLLVGGVLTAGFLLFRDAWAVVVAHALIDAPLLLFAGVLLRRSNEADATHGQGPMPA